MNGIYVWNLMCKAKTNEELYTKNRRFKAKLQKGNENIMGNNLP
jgi:hypothetical protein